MAANLAGMFAQLNNSIQQNPMAEGGVGNRLIDGMSQSAGNMMGKAVNATAPQGAAPVNPMQYMNEGGQALAAKQQLGALDLSSPEGLQKAALIYQQMGRPEEAMRFTQLAEQKKTAMMARLEKNQVEMNKELGLKEAMKVAMQRGDRAAHAGLVSRQIEPGTYLASVQSATDASAAAEVARVQGLEDYETKKKIDRRYEKPKPQSFSTHGKLAEDLGYAPGTPEYNAFVERKANQGTMGTSGGAASTSGKLAVDRGFVPGTPEFVAEVNKITMEDNPRAWNQYQEVRQSIEKNQQYKAAEEQHIKAQQAITFLDEATRGNPKAIPALEASLATLLQSSVRAQAEIENIRTSNDIAGRVLDDISKGITGTLTPETLASYSDAINAVVQAASSERGLVINQLVNAAGGAGMSEQVQELTRDSFGVAPNTSNWADRK